MFDGLPVAAGFSTRAGGVSRGAFASLNTGLHVGDDEALVRENRRRVLASLGFDAAHSVVLEQVHGHRVVPVDAPSERVIEADGIVTRTPGLALTIGAADCAVVLLAAPGARAVGACHAGWRGAAGGIVTATVRVLETLGAEAADIRAYIGPCISADRFEVGEEVAAQFDSACVIRRPSLPKPHVDLPAVLRAELTSLGLPESHIETENACTAGNLDRFFSHRAEHGHTGRMMGVIGSLRSRGE
ncbi:MAG: peptidoglycan editing factor PgeF [Bacteroidota bacterium]